MIAMLRCGPSNRPFAATAKTEMAEFTHCGQNCRSVPQSERQLFVPADAQCVQLFKTRYLKAAAALLMKELSAATRAISLRPLREITHKSWYRRLGS
jgi:hypothetical protein